MTAVPRYVHWFTKKLYTTRARSVCIQLRRKEMFLSISPAKKLWVILEEKCAFRRRGRERQTLDIYPTIVAFEAEYRWEIGIRAIFGPLQTTNLLDLQQSLLAWSLITSYKGKYNGMCVGHQLVGSHTLLFSWLNSFIFLNVFDRICSWLLNK